MHQLVARLERKFPKHPRDINWDKVNHKRLSEADSSIAQADKYAGSILVRHCHDIVNSLAPAYSFYEVRLIVGGVFNGMRQGMALFQNKAMELLERSNRNLGTLSVRISAISVPSETPIAVQRWSECNSERLDGHILRSTGSATIG